MTPATLQSEAFILKKRTFATRDALFTFFTKDTGKISVFAKNIKSVTSRRVSHLQTGNLVQMMVQTKGDAYYLRESSIISAYSKIKKSRPLLNSCYLLFYVLDRLLPEREAEVQIFALLKHHMSVISRTPDRTDASLEQTLNDILNRLGYLKQPKPLNLLVRDIEALINEKIPPDII